MAVSSAVEDAQRPRHGEYGAAPATLGLRPVSIEERSHEGASRDRKPELAERCQIGRWFTESKIVVAPGSRNTYSTTHEVVDSEHDVAIQLLPHRHCSECRVDDDGELHQRLSVARFPPRTPTQRSFESEIGSTDSDKDVIHDRAQPLRRSHGGILRGIQVRVDGRRHRAAATVPEYDEQADGLEVCDGVLDTPEALVSENIARHSHGEQVIDRLVKDEIDGDACVRTAEDGRKGRLLGWPALDVG